MLTMRTCRLNGSADHVIHLWMCGQSDCWLSALQPKFTISICVTSPWKAKVRTGLGRAKDSRRWPKIVWARFSTLSWTVFIMTAIVLYTQACPGLELKILPRLYPVGCGAVGSISPWTPLVCGHCGLMGLFYTIKARSNNTVDFTIADYHRLSMA
jgi:hypothetical protein